MFYIFVLFLFVCIGVAYVSDWFTGSNLVKNTYNTYFLNKSTAIPACEVLPSSENIRFVFERNSIEIQKIERESGLISIGYDDVRCPGKAYVYVSYDESGNINKAKEMIGDDFYGFPVVIVYAGKS
jgi:hypothetical protein